MVKVGQDLTREKMRIGRCDEVGQTEFMNRSKWLLLTNDLLAQELDIINLLVSPYNPAMLCQDKIWVNCIV